MSSHNTETFAAEIADGTLIPVLGPGALDGVTDAETGAPIPADNDALIEAITAGRPLPKKVMYEFSRVAMHYELQRGRNFVNRFLTDLYGRRSWSPAPLHGWLAEQRPPLIIDFNRDTQLQEAYRDTPHLLIAGVSRIGGSDYRFRMYRYDNGEYVEYHDVESDPGVPILFKPLGTPMPDANYVASDADFVDYVTELMGGFGLPRFLKRFRQGKRYVLLGLRLNRDTERMVLNDIIYDAAPEAGYAFLPEPTKGELRFCDRHQLALVEQEWATMLGVSAPPEAGAALS